MTKITTKPGRLELAPNGTVLISRTDCGRDPRTCILRRIGDGFCGREEAKTQGWSDPSEMKVRVGCGQIVKIVND